MTQIYLSIPLICLAASLVIGVAGRVIGRRASHCLAIAGVATAWLLSLWVYADVHSGNEFNANLYTWLISGDIGFHIGFLIDELSATMMVVVTFVSLMVHIYTIGYMADDPGYQRFFCYISLFTFAMLMLVMSNNFLLLFFGWEMVGLVSYLLIGFWYQRESAIVANLKAFLVNRVGDFGFLLGIAGVLYLFGSLDYAAVFTGIDALGVKSVVTPFGETDWITVICLLLFVGAMGKSAQVPLHVWLPDSMEGPTPISALIHAATMVTAGIFMVARMSPLFEQSETALSFILIIGATTAIFMGLIGLVQNDIKRVVAYSTLSQLGYMTVALGASAYHIAIFHLGTHAFFKALLFLSAGSVIIAMHHQQDMRKMGGLRTIMPVTYIAAAVGTLALTGIPPFSGFFSKDAIIIAAGSSQVWGARYAYFAVLFGVFITAFYAFRMLFMTFHGKINVSAEQRLHLRESPNVVTFPLLALAVPSLIVGAVFFGSIIHGTYFGDSIYIAPNHDSIAELVASTAGQRGFALTLVMIWHGVNGAPFWLALGGGASAWYCYCKNPLLPERIADTFRIIYRVLQNKYGVDALYQTVFATTSKRLGALLSGRVDLALIDGVVVNGVARLVRWCALGVRNIQTGFTYHYAFVMVLGLLLLIRYFV